jgi:hypothetical protein
VSTYEDIVFDLMESEAWLNVFFDFPEFEGAEAHLAEAAAIIVTGSPVGHFPKRRGDKLTVWLGRGIERWSFRGEREAMEKVAEILESPKRRPIEYRFENPGARRFRAFLKRRESRKAEASP